MIFYATTHGTICQQKYLKVRAKEVTEAQHHLSNKEREILEQILPKYKIIFDWKLGLYPTVKFHIDLVDGAQLVYKSPYQVPFQRETQFKQELHNLWDNGVLEKCGPST